MIFDPTTLSDEDRRAYIEEKQAALRHYREAQAFALTASGRAAFVGLIRSVEDDSIRAEKGKQHVQQ